MLACRIVSMLMAFVSIVLLHMALTTDYWVVVYGVKDIMHSGLWQQCKNGNCTTPGTTKEYIAATRAFLILASLLALVSALSLVFSFTSCAHGVMSKPFIPSMAAFTAALFTLIAVAVYTAESWNNNTDPKVHYTYEWSFYLGWAAFPMLLLAGIFSLVAHVCSPRSGYERV
ncbi:protein NKG7-like [Elgaria multicarinata webbii]|uniref:protein NKG7-like n=1 Tax=Elgaria multicarinata webbii TaxID=159646 RepID=UPI002FCCC339